MIWFWLIIFVLLGVPLIASIVSARIEARKPGFTKDKISGFRGWLLWLTVMQCLNLLRTVGEFKKTTESYDAVVSMPNGHLAVTGEVALNVAIIAFQVFVIIAMFRRSTLFPRLFLYLWLASIAVPILDWFLIVVTLGVPLGELVDADGIKGIVGPLIGGGVWVAYVFASVRVKNTFIRGRQEPRPDESAVLS